MSEKLYADQFDANYAKSDGCWEWAGTLFSNGYGRFKGVGAHRVAYRLAHGGIPAGYFICHRCDNPRCVNPSHLFAGTHADNMADMVAKGRNAPPRLSGEHHGCAKLNRTQVAEIRSRYASGGVTYRSLAADYGVSNTNIRQIVIGRKWVV